MTLAAPPTLWNLRDLGGVSTPSGPVRRGVVFRSNGLTSLDGDDIAALAGLGFATAIDLREPSEAEHTPVTTGDAGIDVRLVPLAGKMVDGAYDMDAYYRDLVAARGVHIAGVVTQLADPAGHPAVVFCVSGKDRTGIISAALLSALGASDEDVIDDYIQTETRMPGWHVDRTLAMAADLGMDPEMVRGTLRAPAQSIRMVLDQMRESDGGAAAYLSRHGADVDALRATLID